jgi:hypothetical protein
VLIGLKAAKVVKTSKSMTIPVIAIQACADIDQVSDPLPA